MASPHVAGAAALYLQGHTAAAASEVASALATSATSGVVTSAGSGSPNRLLFVGSSSSPAPTADIKANGSDGPITVASGTAVTISWTSTNASGCSVTPGGWTGTSGSQSVSPTSTTTYVLNCDSGAATDQVVVNVTSSTPTSVHIGDIDGSTQVSRKNWKATATFTVHDAGHAPVAGATVNFNYTGGISGSGSCLTGTGGTCSFTTGAIKNNLTSVTFTVTGISGSNLAYVSSANHDVDAGTNGTTITITR